mgnify:FL=1
MNKTHTLLKKERLKSLAFLAPSGLGVLTFFVVPFIVIIYYSLLDNPIQKNFVGLDNFKSLITNSAFQSAAFNTLIFSLIAVPSAVILSLLLALLLDCRIPFKSQLRTIFLSPLMVPVASVILVWQVMFDTNGALNQIIGKIGITPVDWLDSDYNQLIVLTLFLWKNLGYNMILFMAGLGNVPNDLIEVAKLEGAGSWKVFWKIKMRYLSPTIFFVAILSLINSFKIFREVYLLTGGYPYGNIYYMQHFMNNQFEKLDYQKLSTAAVIMSIVMVIIIGILFLVEDKFGKEVEE